MQNLIKAGRIFYAIGIAGLGIQQFMYKEFRPVIIPPWPSVIHDETLWAYVTGACLVIAGLLVFFTKHVARVVLIDLAIALVLLILGLQVTHLLFGNHDPFQLFFLNDGLKELAISGGAFVVAGSYSSSEIKVTDEKLFAETQDTFVRIGSIFLSIMLIVFGYEHFKYKEFVEVLVPNWIPAHLFWTYFGGVALIGAGIFIILKIQLKLVAFLLGLMLLIWLIVLHIPRAIADPSGLQGNEVSSVFEALAFSGIAFIISYMPSRKAVR